MKLRKASEARPRRCSLRPQNAEGGGAVACAAAAPLIVLALAVAADHAHVGALPDPGSACGGGRLARRSGGDGAPAGRRRRRRPGSPPPFSPATPLSGATGKPSVAATNRAAMVTATVAYDGVAPSNFGSVFGYGAFHVSASATSHALVANSEARATP